MDSPPIKRALISVSDKLGLADFAKALSDHGVEILSTGGTARHLSDAGIEVRDVADYTGFPEMMDGRLRTLHPKVFGGILGRHDRDDDMQGLVEHGIESFELVVVNLYPFEATVAKEGTTMPEAIEQIDIGGPSLVRAAAKNHAFVTIATNPNQYGRILEEVERNGCTSLETRQWLAGEAFARTASYDQAISGYFQSQLESGDKDFPATVSMAIRRKSKLRYGENPHQPAALYTRGTNSPSLVAARQLNGKELSYNNYLDLDSALSIARSLPDAAVSVIKHNNPCGAASATTLSEAAKKAMDGDPVSAFGSVLGCNQTVDAKTAEVLATPGLFIEAIVAPRFDPAAVEILTTKPKWKSNVRLMEVGSLAEETEPLHYRMIDGGVLVQHVDNQPDVTAEWQVVSETQPTQQQRVELEFAWKLVRHVKSNAIVLTNNRAAVGVGAGQMSRVDSVEIAIRKAGDRAIGSVLASDAFFPFPDSIEEAQRAGVAAIIEPGGSRRDEEVITACNKFGLPMIFTGRRHFKH